ncbi:TPA: hypothetical protein ACX6QR_003976 [Photobacterium damselae]
MEGDIEELLLDIDNAFQKRNYSSLYYESDIELISKISLFEFTKIMNKTREIHNKINIRELDDIQSISNKTFKDTPEKKYILVIFHSNEITENLVLIKSDKYRLAGYFLRDKK